MRDPGLPPAPDILQRCGPWLGLLGVFIFALTLPMTRLATGTSEWPQSGGLYLAVGRAVVAAALSALCLFAVRAPLPHRSDWKPLALVAGGVVSVSLSAPPWRCDMWKRCTPA